LGFFFFFFFFSLTAVVSSRLAGFGFLLCFFVARQRSCASHFYFQTVTVTEGGCCNPLHRCARHASNCGSTSTERRLCISSPASSRLASDAATSSFDVCRDISFNETEIAALEIDPDDPNAIDDCENFTTVQTNVSAAAASK
jgi:hypothetical protein